MKPRSFFLNLIELKKGEGMCVGADGPHAWVFGGQSCFTRI